jgi:osmoprotectant transport system permease protein
VTWLANNWQILPPYLLDHVRLSIIPIVLGFALALPLGWLAWRFRVVGGPLLGLVGVLYTIPSLALFVILPSVTGGSILSEANVVRGLTIYAVAILARSVAEALASVDADVRQSATALGYSRWRRFWAVEFPLGGPVMLAGVRVAAVSTVSLVTVGSLIGVSSLGNLFTDGWDRRSISEILVGVVLVALVALVLDSLLVLLGRALMPWTRGARRSGRRAAVAA